MGCSNGKDRVDDLSVDDIDDDQKGRKAHDATSPSVGQTQQRNKYAADPNDDDDDGGGDGDGGGGGGGKRDDLVRRMSTRKAGGRRQSADDDEEEEEDRPIAKDADMERLLEAYKNKKSGGQSTLLTSNKHTQAMKRNEQQQQQRQSHQPASPPHADEDDSNPLVNNRPRTKVDLKIVASGGDDDSLGDDGDGGDIDTSGIDSDRRPPSESPVSPPRNGWEPNSDFDALTGTKGFTLKHKPRATPAKSNINSPNPKSTNGHSSPQQDQITPHLRKESLPLIPNHTTAHSNTHLSPHDDMLPPGMIVDDQHDSSTEEFSPSRGLTGGLRLGMQRGDSNSTTGHHQFGILETAQPTRNNSQQRPIGGPTGHRTRPGAEDDEFDF